MLTTQTNNPYKLLVCPECAKHPDNKTFKRGRPPGRLYKVYDNKEYLTLMWNDNTGEIEKHQVHTSRDFGVDWWFTCINCKMVWTEGHVLEEIDRFLYHGKKESTAEEV